MPITWDNTLQARSRGDFAVPTLFNGNFDAEYESPSLLSTGGILRNIISNGIAGWSFRNNATGATWANNVVNNGDLVDWKDIPTLNQPLIISDYRKNANGQLLVERFLKAGIMEGHLFKHTDIGTPQGGICSPLLANIYLHQLDLYWWQKYGNLDRKEKERRRTRLHRKILRSLNRPSRR